MGHRLSGHSGTNADLDTTSGDIHVTALGTASGTLRAHSVSGDVRVTGPASLRVNAHSVSGRVHTH
nr:DUF4097 family beta strand repeat-containing protein [Streptomyces sp. ICBB 8177]